MDSGNDFFRVNVESVFHQCGFLLVLLGVETGVSPEVCHDFLAESMNQHRNNGD